MKNPGIIVRMADSRTVIVYKDQPLKESRGKTVLHLVDENYNIINNDNGIPKILIRDEVELKEQMQGSTVIGFVD